MIEGASATTGHVTWGSMTTAAGKRKRKKEVLVSGGRVLSLKGAEETDAKELR